MRETVFQRELSDAFRKAGWWAAKWPDMPAGRMGVGEGGRLRFNLPKPLDLVLRSPDGLFGAVECKLSRGPGLVVDARFREQLTRLLNATGLHGLAFVAVNFRYARKRTGRTNRAFLLRLDDAGNRFFPDKIDLCSCQTGDWQELPRIPGGWRIT